MTITMKALSGRYKRLGTELNRAWQREEQLEKDLEAARKARQEIYAEHSQAYRNLTDFKKLAKRVRDKKRAFFTEHHIDAEEE